MVWGCCAKSSERLKMTWPLDRRTTLALLASPTWLSLAVKFTSDLSPRKMRWARGSERERFGSTGTGALGKSIWMFRKNGGGVVFLFHLFCWLSPRNTILFCWPTEFYKKEPARRKAATYDPPWK